MILNIQIQIQVLSDAYLLINMISGTGQAEIENDLNSKKKLFEILMF